MMPGRHGPEGHRHRAGAARAARAGHRRRAPRRPVAGAGAARRSREGGQDRDRVGAAPARGRAGAARGGRGRGQRRRRLAAGHRAGNRVRGARVVVPGPARIRSSRPPVHAGAGDAEPGLTSHGDNRLGPPAHRPARDRRGLRRPADRHRPTRSVPPRPREVARAHRRKQSIWTNCKAPGGRRENPVSRG